MVRLNEAMKRAAEDRKRWRHNDMLSKTFSTAKYGR